MKAEGIKNLVSQFEAAMQNLNGIECRSARVYNNCLDTASGKILKKLLIKQRSL